VIRHGDSFWSIATARLETSTGDVPPDQEQIAHYWQALVQANLTMLPVPGHPDLLFPGDRIRLPPLLRGPEER
jgi:nucleoid-associated protein YgaU